MERILSTPTSAVSVLQPWYNHNPEVPFPRSKKQIVVIPANRFGPLFPHTPLGAVFRNNLTQDVAEIIFVDGLSFVLLPPRPFWFREQLLDDLPGLKALDGRLAKDLKDRPEEGGKVALIGSVDFALLCSVERPLHPRATRELCDLAHRIPVVAETIEQFGRAVDLGEFFQIGRPPDELAADNPHLRAIVIDEVLNIFRFRRRSSLQLDRNAAGLLGRWKLLDPGVSNASESAEAHRLLRTVWQRIDALNKSGLAAMARVDDLKQQLVGKPVEHVVGLIKQQRYVQGIDEPKERGRGDVSGHAAARHATRNEHEERGLTAVGRWRLYGEAGRNIHA